MNNILIKGTQNFMGVNIPVIEGGFGEGQKSILVKTLEKIHNEPLKYLNKTINRQRKNFIDGEDLIDLTNKLVPVCNQSIRDILIQCGYTERGIKATLNQDGNIYLLSERGYIKLVSAMSNDNPTKWEVMQNVIDDYFHMRKLIKTNNNLSLPDDIKQDIINLRNDANYIRSHVHVKKLDSDVYVKTIKNYLGIKTISEDKAAYELIKDMFLTELNVSKFEDIPVNSDNLILLNDCCRKYKTPFEQISMFN